MKIRPRLNTTSLVRKTLFTDSINTTVASIMGATLKNSHRGFDGVELRRYR